MRDDLDGRRGNGDHCGKNNGDECGAEGHGGRGRETTESFLTESLGSGFGEYLPNDLNDSVYSGDGKKDHLSFTHWA
jgi:hypothetical protein